MPQAPDYCPVCGAEVPSNARACPECGADEKTGWSEKARYDELGIPEESFDYEKFVDEEFGRKAPRRRYGLLWVVVAMLLLLAFAVGMIRW